MNAGSRHEIKVGLFVLVGLILIALLMLNFSKGLSLFSPTYQIRVVMPTVAGLKPKSDVMVSGVSIGRVASTELSPGGTNVIINVKILSRFNIRSNAKFHIDALGFLGDQYMAITPSNDPNAPFLKDGDTVEGQAPFNLQEAVRSTSGLLDQARQTLQNLNQTITNVNQNVLSQQALTNFGNTISDLQNITASARRTIEAVEGAVKTNTAPLAFTMTNLQNFSERLNDMAIDLEQTISTNRGDWNETVKNMRAASQNLNQISADLQSGKGLAGSLLKDEALKAQTAAMITNMNTLAANMSLFSSNLNQRGIWSMMWKQKHAGNEEPRRGKQ